MDAEGKIIVKLPLQSGVSKAGNNWSKQEYVLETQEAYPKKIHFSFFGDRANQYPLEVGDTVRLSFDIDSHEYNGRWFTSINGWKAEKIDLNNQAPQTTQQNTTGVSETVPPPPVFTPAANEPDDLPF